MGAASSRNTFIKAGRNLDLSRFGSSCKGAAWSADPVFGVDRGRPRFRFTGSGVYVRGSDFGVRARRSLASSGEPVEATGLGPRRCLS